MSEIKLFNIQSNAATEIAGSASGLEKPLQRLFEQNLDTLLGVRFLASERWTGSVHAGRIDTLGIDENGSPVIVEYKRSKDDNVISQGLYYLDWLMDHKADFKLLVLERLGGEAADGIDWTGPRLICVASDFTKFDEHAIRQINRNIDLVRYKRFGPELLALELDTTVSAQGGAKPAKPIKPVQPSGEEPPEDAAEDGPTPLQHALSTMNDGVRQLYDEVRDFILNLGDDVVEKPLKHHVAYRRLKNFAAICIMKKGLCLYLKVDPETVAMEEGFTRDVTSIGHLATGDLEVWVGNEAQLAQALPLLARAYEGT